MRTRVVAAGFGASESGFGVERRTGCMVGFIVMLHTGICTG